MHSTDVLQSVGLALIAIWCFLTARIWVYVSDGKYKVKELAQIAIMTMGLVVVVFSLSFFTGSILVNFL